MLEGQRKAASTAAITGWEATAPGRAVSGLVCRLSTAKRMPPFRRGRLAIHSTGLVQDGRENIADPA